MAHLQRMDAVRMDAVGKSNDQVKKLEAEGGIELGGTPKKLLCFKGGDGKVMMSGSCGKCWNCNLKYDQFEAHFICNGRFSNACSHWLPYVLHPFRPQCWICGTLLCKGGDRHWEMSQGQCPHTGLTRSPQGHVPCHFYPPRRGEAHPCV